MIYFFHIFVTSDRSIGQGIELTKSSHTLVPIQPDRYGYYRIVMKYNREISGQYEDLPLFPLRIQKSSE